MPNGSLHWEIIITLGLRFSPGLPEEARWLCGNDHVEIVIVLSHRVSLLSWVEALGEFLRVWVVMGVNSIDPWEQSRTCKISSCT